MIKYLKLRSDFLFMKVMDQNEDMLIPLLRHLIPERTIKSITFQNTEMTSTNEEGKMPRYDILCVDENGASFIVEMQCIQYEDYFDRVLIYSAFQLSASLMRGEAYANARPVYVISIIDYMLRFEMDTDSLRNQLVRSAHVFLDDNNAKPLSNKLIFIFLQLPAVSGITEESTWLEKFAYVVRNSETFSEIPEEVKSERYFVDLLIKSDRTIMTAEDWKKYDCLERDDREKQACIDFARKEGKEEGKQEGIAEGFEKGIAKGRQEGIAEGFEKALSQVAAAYGISIDEVRKKTSSVAQDA